MIPISSFEGRASEEPGIHTHAPSNYGSDVT
jgi:hypothetical protein